MSKGDSGSVLAPVSPLTDGRLGRWDLGLWLLALMGASSLTIAGVVSLPTMPVLASVAPLLVVAGPVLVVIAASMLLYGLTTALINWMGRVNRPKLWSALRATRVGMALMPLAWIVGLAALPWIWPALLAATLIVPVVFALFQRFAFQRFLDRWAASSTISETWRRRALWLGADIKAVNADGQSVLECAISAGHVGIVQDFANLRDPRPVFAFQDALTKVIEAPGLNEADRIAMAHSLMDAAKRVDPATASSLLLQAMYKAIQQQGSDGVAVLNVLLGSLNALALDTVKPEQRDNDLGATLRFAVVQKNKAAVRCLLSSDLKCDLTVTGRDGTNAMQVARASEDKDMIALLEPAYQHDLVGHGDVNIALRDAAGKGEEGRVDQLLMAGAKVGAADDKGRTPLDHAAEHGHLDMVKKLFPLTKEVNQDLARQSLLAATCTGQAAVVEALLSLCDEGEYGLRRALRVRKENLTAIEWAARRGDLATVRVLYGPVKTAVPAFLPRALFLAALQGHVDMVDWFIVQGVAPQSALSGAAIGGYREIMEHLLGCEGTSLLAIGADPYGFDRGTPLDLAAQHGHVEMVQYLFQLTVTEEQSQRTAKLEAAEAADWKIMRGVMGSPKPKALEPDHSPLKASQAVFAAADGGQLEVLNWLCTQQTQITIGINDPDDNGRTLLHWAATSESKRATKVVEWLLAQGADKTIQDKMGRMAFELSDNEDIRALLFVPKTLVEAVKHGDLAAVREKVETARDGDFYLNEPGRPTVLKLALKSKPRRLDIAEALLKVKPEIAKQSDLGFIPYLCWAVQQYDVELVQLLVAHTEVNVESASNITALMYAVIFEPKEEGRMLAVVKMLVDAGANVAVKYPSDPGSKYPKPHLGGRSLLHQAASNPDVEVPVLDYLVKQGLTLDATNDAGMNVLQCAVRAGCRPDVIEWLVDQGADIQETDDQGNTLLHLAVQGLEAERDSYSSQDATRYEATIQCLLDQGVAWDAKNVRGEAASSCLRYQHDQLKQPLLKRLRTGEVAIKGAASAGHNMHADAAHGQLPGAPDPGEQPKA